MSRWSERKVEGCKMVPALPRDFVQETRVLEMPDGTQLRARHRISGWTVEIPLALALEIFTPE